MIDSTPGSKRRLADVDENERITLRQTILNMSICKLQKDQGRKEPSLLRSVAITNTVRLIEKEMDEEAIFDYQSEFFAPLVSPCPPNCHNERLELICKCKDGPSRGFQRAPIANPGYDRPSRLEKSPLPDLQCSEVLNESDLQPKEVNKFGAIGDHRKNKPKSVEKEESPSLAIPAFWDNLSTPVGSSHLFDSLDSDNRFPNIDISLYDYDNSLLPSFPVYSGYDDWRMYPQSCASEYEKGKSDSFFEELDQIMQVLVGM